MPEEAPAAPALYSVIGHSDGGEKEVILKDARLTDARVKFRESLKLVDQFTSIELTGTKGDCYRQRTAASAKPSLPDSNLPTP